MFGRMEQVVMIVPVDAYVDKAQHITRENGNYWAQGLEIDAMRHLQFQHHDGNDNGEHAVTEGFDPVTFHLAMLPGVCVGSQSAIAPSLKSYRSATMTYRLRNHAAQIC